jgi:hypothetical protein
MPLVHTCATEGCGTLTMGELCLDCEREQEAVSSQPITREAVNAASRGAAPVELSGQTSR